MRRMPRIALLFVALVAVGPLLAGCESFDPDSLDPFGLNEKKKLPGQRELLFPNGVPGVAQGIPPEYQAGNQAPVVDDLSPTGAETQQAAGESATPAAQTATSAPVQPVRTSNVAKPKPKARPKPRRVAKPKPQPKPTETASKPPATESPWPSTPQQNTTQQGTSAPWPSQQPQQKQGGWPAAEEQKLAPWPSAPPSGTFSKQ